MRAAWWVMAGLWLYETAVFFGWLVLPLFGIWEASAHTTPFITKHLILVALILNFLAFVGFLWAARSEDRIPSLHVFHFAAGAWLWLTPTIGAWWWDGEFDGGNAPVVPPDLPTGVISPEQSLAYSTLNRSYQLWKFVIEVGVSASLGVTLSALIVLGIYFMMSRFRGRRVRK